MPETATPPGATPPKRPTPPAAARPKKVLEMPSEPWEGALPDALRERFGDRAKELKLLGGQKLAIVDIGAAADVLAFLKNEQTFDYLVDVTAVHWPQRDEPFELVWILYSFERNERVRVKAALAGDAKAPSAVALYNTANWLEREVYDMFGIEFENHPDLKRILMPDEWDGFPLRKEYGIYQQDDAWVRENLKIESAQ